MTASFTEHQMSLTSFNHMSRRDTAFVRSGGLGARLGRALEAVMARLREMPSRHAVLRDLNRLTDRELADIGLTRAELHRVFDANFVPNRQDA